MAFKLPRHATTNYKMVLPFVSAANNRGGHARFESRGFEPLSVEYLHYSDHNGNPVYSMMQWYIQNGDLMRDPDLTFSVDESTGTVLPISYQLDGIAVYQEVFRRNSAGQLMYSKRLLNDLDECFWCWLKNLSAQGFDPSKPMEENT